MSPNSLKSSTSFSGAFILFFVPILNYCYGEPVSLDTGQMNHSVEGIINLTKCVRINKMKHYEIIQSK